MEMMQPERMTGGGVALSFPANDKTTVSMSSPKAPPLRLRERLLVEPKIPLSADGIEAKLREANLRRQQFYELLSSKARAKSRSPSKICLQEEDLGQRLEAKLNAAQEKRLSILAKAQLRLARLDELRQAAKTELEMRFEKERDELSRKVKSRVQQAEANRMLLLKAYRQTKAAKRERATQFLMQKMTQENKYKECVRAAISQKRATAERKRLGLLEAEKTRASARFLRGVQQVARYVSQREIERKRMKDQLEYRLQRAKKQRAEYLRQRRNLNINLHANSKMMDEQGEFISRKLTRCWRQFVKLSKTTLSLAKAFMSLEINEESAKSMPFEQLALLIESATTIQILKALVDRLESRFTLSQAAMGRLSSMANIDHLLKGAALPNHRGDSSNATWRGAKAIKSTKEEAQGLVKLSRYPVRLVLCAYMIMGHSDAVFNGQGDCEFALVEFAATFIKEFELLIKIITEGPIQISQEEMASAIPSKKTFRTQLEAFDKAWCSYLHRFVVWKYKDTELLEKDLVKAACQLELSMIQICKLTSGDDGSLAHDTKAIQKQVSEEQKLLKETVQQLSGSAGLQNMESAVSDIRSEILEAKELGSSLTSSTAHISSSGLPGLPEGSSVSAFGETSYLAESRGRSSHIARSLSEIIDFCPSKEVGSSPSKSTTDGRLNSDPMLVSENEILVNEIVHDHRCGFADSLSVTNEDQNSLKAKVRETMDKAFWDGIIESTKQDEPEFGWVLKLMKEVRDELCELSPQSWRQEIVETIDIDILSQLLRSGALDIDYLGKILEFALVTLQKLCAPANDEEMKGSHNNFLKELGPLSQAGNKSHASFAHLMIKGLCFVLQEIQVLKREISKARVRLVEPLIKGPAGLEYLRKAFANRYGPPSDAQSSLPSTRQWIASVNPVAEQEWDEYTDSLSATTSNTGFLQVLLPTTLRTGGAISMGSKTGSPTSATGFEQPECRGEKIDILVRLGLLKLVSGVEGLTLDALPETLKLNLPRLRDVQSQLQKVIVNSTSMLVLRQMLLTENLVTNSLDMDNIASECIKQLPDLLDNVEDVGISEIVDTFSGLLKDSGKVLDTERLQARKEVMTSMLTKSLQAGDAVFEHVSRSVYLAIRGAVFGGSGFKGQQSVEAALRRVGAALLASRVIEAAEVLVVVASVSCSVHGAWYEELLKNI